MGTTGTWQTAAQVRQELLDWSNYDKVDDHGNRKFCKVLASAKGAGGFWILIETEFTVYRDEVPPEHNHYVTATFHKMSSGGGMTYYKSMDIDCHPYAYSCPKSWLDRIQPQGKYGESWLESAKAHHDKKAKIAKGLKFIVDGISYEALEVYSRGYWKIKHLGTNMVYRMKTSIIQDQAQFID